MEKRGKTTMAFSNVLLQNRTEELILIESESNLQYRVLVSPEDAIKARTDSNFAQKLLQKTKTSLDNNIPVRNNTVLLSQLTTVSEEEVDDPSPSEEPHNPIEQNEHDLSNISNQYLWKREEILLLIELYKKLEKEFTSGIPIKDCWKKISKKLEETGYNIPANKCNIKFQALKRTYKSVVEHNKKSGNNRRKWEYYDLMHELFCEKPWMKPLATASSDYPTEEKRSMEDQMAKEPATKKQKRNSLVEDYLKENLKIKEEREKNAERRHNEKIACLTRLENIMASLLTK